MKKTPFFGLVTVLNGVRSAMGPGLGTLSVTSIIITNFSTSTQQLFLFNPLFTAGTTSCDASKIIGGTYPQFNLLLEPNKSIQLQFPTALVFGPVDGLTCLAAEVTTALSGSVEVSVNGFIQ